MATRIAVRGAWGTVEWAVDPRGRSQAEDFFLSLDPGDEAKVLRLFRRLAEMGRISNADQFKSLGESGLGLWEFRIFQVRFLGDFRPGRRFVVAFGVRKKKDKLDREDISTALRILTECA